MKYWALVAIATTFALVLSCNPLSYAWHENLGFDANKAAELYQTKPNDPAIVQWKNSLQLAINSMGQCLDVETAISCQSLMSNITSNCNSHPNELLACNDSRIAQYPIVLKQVQEAQAKAAETRAKNEAQVKNASLAYDACSETIDKHKLGWGSDESKKCGPIILGYCNDPTLAQYLTQCKDY